MSHRVEDNLDPFTVGKPANLSFKVLLSVENDVICSRAARHFSFLASRNGGVDVHPQAFEHLDDQQTHAARPGVYQRPVARMQRHDVVHQEMGGHGLQQGGRAGGEIHIVGNLHQQPGWDGLLFGIRASVHGVGDAIAHGDFGYAGADGHHYAGCFPPGGPGEIGRRVGSFAAGHVGVVDANVADVNDGLPGRRRGFGHIFVFQHIGRADFVGSDAFHNSTSNVLLPVYVCLCVPARMQVVSRPRSVIRQGRTPFRLC